MILRGAREIEQASLFQWSFSGFSFFQNTVAATEVDIGRFQIAEVLVGAAVIAGIDEGSDRVFECARQGIVFQQDSVLERLVPLFRCPAGQCAAMSREGSCPGSADDLVPLERGP